MGTLTTVVVRVAACTLAVWAVHPMYFCGLDPIRRQSLLMA